MDRLNKRLSSIGTKDGGITVGSTAYAGHAERMQADRWCNIIFGGRRPFSIHFSLFPFAVWDLTATTTAAIAMLDIWILDFRILPMDG